MSFVSFLTRSAGGGAVGGGAVEGGTQLPGEQGSSSYQHLHMDPHHPEEDRRDTGTGKERYICGM